MTENTKNEKGRIKIRVHRPIFGTPITFLDKYNPKQFEIVDAANRYLLLDYFNVNERVIREHNHCTNINGKPTYFRILIRKKVS